MSGVENTESKKIEKKRALFFLPLIQIWGLTAKNQSIPEDVLAFEYIKTAKDVNKRLIDQATLALRDANLPK